MSKKSITFTIIAILISTAAIGSIYLYKRQKSGQTVQPSSIQTFNECKASGGLVRETYPEQCELNGKTFVQPTTTPATKTTKYITFAMEDNKTESFIVKTDNEQLITQAKASLQSNSNLIVTGKVLEGNGGFNIKSDKSSWNWHFDPTTVSFADFTIEVCDARPTYVAENINDWKGKQYCPWGARIVSIAD